MSSTITLPPRQRQWLLAFMAMALLFALLLCCLPLDHWLRTAPPADGSIELSDAQLRDLTAAWETGFDHPDPNSNDPCERLRLLPYKKLSAWRRQFSRRGFTMDKVRRILRTGRREVYRHPTKPVSYTRIYDAQGNWIVVDFVDCIIWQVAPYNFK